MRNRVSQIIVTSLIVFAVIGFTAFLVKEPTRLLQMLLIYGVIIGLFIVIFRFLFRNQTHGTDRNYAKALKQSKKRQKQKNRVRAPHLRVVGSNPHRLRKTKPSSAKKNKKHNLKVIEGRKNKKKNRALF